MQYDFLKAFPKRMKNVGLYALLFSNSGGKAIWKQYGFETADLQLNMVFTVLLFIMEQSLKEEPCTIDDIAAFIDSINTQYFRGPMVYEDCRSLGDFIVNTVLSNEGRPMYFEGCDYEEGRPREIHISYVANRIIYPEPEVRRTSYYLTDDGYNLLLGTLEVESNMKLTIQEMVFKMHLERQSYDRALDDIKNVFNLLRIQLQKIAEAMVRVRRNVLTYNVEDYERLQLEDLATIEKTRKDFQGYRETVQARVRELENSSINVNALDPQDEQKLSNLREIERYLGRAIDEHQRILNSHFDLKALYSDELEKISEMALVQRFGFRAEVFDPVLAEPSLLERVDMFLQPLFNRDPDRIFNPGKAFEPQHIRQDGDEEETEEEIDFDEEAWQAEQERRRREKMEKYERSMTVILEAAFGRRKISLSEIRDGAAQRGEQKNLIPQVSVFKEIMVEFLRIGRIDLAALRKERADYIQEETTDFRLHEMVLKLADEHPDWPRGAVLAVERRKGAGPVVFENVEDEDGETRRIRCSEVVFRVLEG